MAARSLAIPKTSTISENCLSYIYIIMWGNNEGANHRTFKTVSAFKGFLNFAVSEKRMHAILHKK